MNKCVRRYIRHGKKQALLLSCSVVVFASNLLAQTADGNAGIQQATDQVKSYFDTGCNLMYAIGAVSGIIGAVKVYQKWNQRDHDTSKVAAAWFGSCIFFGHCSYCTKIFFRAVKISSKVMANSAYQINKSINKPIEFKGLKAQYIWYLGGGLVVLFILFVVMYLLGVNTYVCLISIVLSGTVLFIRVQRLSHKYGEYGMMKKVAIRSIPKVIRCNSRKVKGFRTISK